MRFGNVAWIITALGALSTQCGGSSNTSFGSGGSSGNDAACAAVAAARCQKRDSCTNGQYVKTHFADEATCESREKSACLASLAAPGTHVDASHDQACASAIQSEACGDFLGPTPPGACLPPQGTRDTGAACVFNGQCASTFCAVPEGAACGTCQALPKAGDSCKLVSDCGPGLICSTDAVCIVPLTSGQKCSRDRDCATGLSCVGASGSSTCMAAGQTAGTACVAATGPECDRQQGLYCAPSTHQCTLAGYAAAGQPCGAVNGQAVECLAGASCQIPKGQKSGTCAAAAADGAPCQVGGSPSCLAPAHCVNGNDGGGATCQIPDASSCG